MVLLMLCGAHREGLVLLLLDHWLPNSLPPPPPHIILLLLSGMLPGDCANPCCFQCLLHAAVTLHHPGISGAEVGLQHLHSITQPHSGLIFLVHVSYHF